MPTSASAVNGIVVDCTQNVSDDRVVKNKIGGPATEGTFREAVFQLAGFCIPLLRPHRHLRISERTIAPRTSRLLFARGERDSRGDKAALSEADRGLWRVSSTPTRRRHVFCKTNSASVQSALWMRGARRRRR